MKPYQDHDPILDKSKAAPHPKQPTRYTYRGRGGSSMSVLRSDFIRERTKKQRKKGAKRPMSIFAAILALMPRRKAARNR